MTKHEPFYTKFDEEWKGMKKKKCDRTKGYELQGVNQGRLSMTCWLRFLSAALPHWR